MNALGAESVEVVGTRPKLQPPVAEISWAKYLVILTRYYPAFFELQTPFAKEP